MKPIVIGYGIVALVSMTGFIAFDWSIWIAAGVFWIGGAVLTLSAAWFLHDAPPITKRARPSQAGTDWPGAARTPPQ